MAFIVKSRLDKSSVMSSVNEILSGCRESEYPCSILKVVTSIAIPINKTVTVPCSIPVGITFLKIDITCCGVAFVARSKSETFCPKSISLTAPPTR